MTRVAAIRAAHRRRERALGRPVWLQPDEVAEIRRRVLPPESESTAALAAEFGVAPARVRRCAHNTAVAWTRNTGALPVLRP